MSTNIKIKELFFDRRAVINAVDAAARKNLIRVGASLRRKARGLIRNPGKKGLPSKPGKPPKNQTGLLKDFIFFSYEPENMSVVVGPVHLQSSEGKNVPSVLEYGGISEAIVRDKRKVVSRHKYNLEPRPYMRPAYEQQEDYIQSVWLNSVK